MQTHDPSNDAHMPRRLADDLKALYRNGPPVPAEADAEMSQLARAHFRRAQRRQVVRYVVFSVTTAAAVFLASLWIVDPFGTRSTPEVGPIEGLAHDVDQSGEVDILDAFLLAKRVDRREALSGRWDLSGDGVVDRTDVDIVAMAAVKLR